MDIRGLQQLKSFRLHKGATYYNLGLTRLLQEDPDAAHDYFVLATLEDALLDTNWQAGPAATMLDANWNREVELRRVAELARRARDYPKDRQHLIVWNPELLLMLERST